VASDHTAPTPNPAQRTSLSQSREPTFLGLISLAL
jgi:hypothetical protein